jgi:hypothetical protein
MHLLSSAPPRKPIAHKLRGRRGAILTTTVLTVVGGLCMPPASGARVDGGVSSAFAARSGSATPKWSAPGLVDRVAPTVHGFALSGVSCPSSSLCVAVDADGQVLYTTRPARTRAWRDVRVSYRSFASLACASTKLCVAGDYHGGVVVSTNPTRAGAWHRLQLSQRYAVVDGVACPSTSLCIAVDSQGNVLSSIDPAGGRNAWQVKKIDTVNGTGVLGGVACPTTRFCAAYDRVGLIFATTDPRGGKSAWHEHKIPFNAIGSELFGISCLTRQLCVVPDANGDVWSSTNPLAGTWVHKAIAPGQRDTALSGGVWCASVRRCAVFYDTVRGNNPRGLLMTTSNPTAGASAWHKTRLKGMSVSAGACPAHRLCLAVTGNGYELTSSRPVHGPWRKGARIDGYNSFTAVSCPRTRACVAVDDAGDILTAAHPSASPSAWQAVRVDPSEGGLVSVSCPGAHLCAAVDAKGGVLTSTDPAGGASAWQRASVDTHGSPTSIDCPSRNLCVFVDTRGAAFTSTKPTAGAGAWTQADIDIDGTSPDLITTVACASAKLCVAGDWSGDVLSTVDPTGGASAWHEISIETPSDALGIQGASCPATTLCVLVDGSGSIITSTNPTGPASAWNFQVNGAGHDSALQGVQCSSMHLCIAFPSTLVPSPGIFVSADPTGGGKAWRLSAIDRTLGTITGVGCRANTSSCVAVDNAGNVIASG